jgi:hypothetical protein
MTPELPVGELDDPGFIELVNTLVRALLAERGPAMLWIINIDNWFDHKWLKFSGYGLVATGTPVDRFDTAKDVSYEDQLTFPPFTPNRVMSQWSYVRVGDGYAEALLPALPHRTKKRHSQTNLRRRIQDAYPAATFVWYSGNTVANGRGSVMIYSQASDQHECWFAGFERRPTWELFVTKGISRGEVEQLCFPV